MKVKVLNLSNGVDELSSGTFQFGIWRTEWQTVQGGTDLGSIMRLIFLQGGTAPEQCKTLLSSMLGRHFRKTSHFIINYDSYSFYSLGTGR